LVGLDDTGRITRFLEKPAPEHVFTDVANAGLCVLETPVLNMIEAPPRDFGLHVFPAALAAGVPLFGWMLPDDGYLIDIGSPEKYARANAEWGRRGATLDR
jgi:NDP-sugar pyrophosphorylase family protein